MSALEQQLTTALSDRYRVERELGVGGMAIVYLAHDLKHDRKVALKLLRPELSAILGGDRFLKEIRTTANLQHPHILPLHDSGEADGLVFYVMPFVEGESLRDRLRHEKQLPVDEAVRIAREVASALDYAHRHGVVHRDIKPENILLHDGQALVADFGIALAASRTDAGTRMTETGMSLGTPHYMAPEQAMGEREITPKADVYALGCVLYEMLVGEPPFSGPTPQAIIARLVTDEPRSLTLQRKTIPPHVEAAVLRALEKLPADRFATAAQFAEALAGTGAATAVPTTQRAAAKARERRVASLAIPAASVIAAMAAVSWMVLHQHPTTPLARYSLAFPASQMPVPDVAVSVAPDGSRIAYIGPGTTSASTLLWIKERDRSEARPIAGTENVWNITFSPDGRSIAFVQEGRLKKIPVIGGSSITLADSVGGNRPGIAWLDDGAIIYVRQGGTELRRVPEVGGTPTTVFVDSSLINYPVALPGSRGVLISRCTNRRCASGQDLWVIDLKSGTPTLIAAGGIRGQFVPTGHVVYVRSDGAMLAVPFDLGSLKVRGAAASILDSVAVINGQRPLFDVSSSGTMLMRAGASVMQRVEHQMVYVDRAGRETPVDTSWTFTIGEWAAGNGGWSLSSDGRRLAIGLETDAGVDIWVKQLPRGPLSRITFDTTADFRPRWMPDGRSIMFVSRRGGVRLWKTRADGTGGDTLLLDIKDDIYEGVWSVDGKWLVFRNRGSTAAIAARDVFGIRYGVDTAPAPLIASRFEESAIALSPDQKWLAYESNESGRREIYIRPFPNTNAGKWQVSTNGGIAPLWSRNSRELFYLSGSRDLTAVSIGAGPTIGERKPLFRVRDDMYGSDFDFYTPWDITPDGRSFIMARRTRVQAGQEAPLILVENWLEELRQKTTSR
jgi:Tol biopolymer transport system component